MIQTGFMLSSALLFQWQQDIETGTAGAAVKINRAVMLVNEALRQCQPRPVPSGRPDTSG